MKKLTYNNLLRGIKIFEKKGYSFEESEKLARLQFDFLATDTTGYWDFEKLAARVLSKEEFEREQAAYKGE